MVMQNNYHITGFIALFVTADHFKVGCKMTYVYTLELHHSTLHHPHTLVQILPPDQSQGYKSSWPYLHVSFQRQPLYHCQDSSGEDIELEGRKEWSNLTV